jgi:UPF0755 protein
MTLRRAAATFGLSVLGIALLAALAAGGWFVWAVFLDRSLPALETNVIVPQGTSAAGVARLLAEQHVIGSAAAFDLLVRLRKGAAEIKAGQFRFGEHKTLDEIYRQMLSGGAQVATWVTFPEGFTARQMAATLADHNLGSRDDLERAFLTTHLEVGGARSKSLEGFLFPSTYLVPVDATPAQIARQLTDEFRAQLPRGAAARAKHLGMRVVDVVTVASLIEREAQADDERRLMAGVYYNRLRRHMPLQVDATIEYIFPRHKTVITRADLASDSPYNTYKHLGLPPTPIANPGRPSLLAAFDPQPSPYLYYVLRGKGHHAFARTLAEHNANVARYLGNP